MHQWKKILAERKLIKEVTIEGCNISITLHDQYNNVDNFYSINNMFANLWYLNSEFSAVFERATPHSNAPFLKLKTINTYPTPQVALNALISFGSNTLKNTKNVALPAEQAEAPDEKEEVEQEVNMVKPKKKRGVIHPWKKLLSTGELIQSLEIKEGLVFIKLVPQYNQRSFFKGINIMLQKLYDSSAQCQEIYRRPTSHTSSPYLILLANNTHPDPTAYLNDLINMAKQPSKQKVAKETDNSSEKGSVAGIVIVAAEEPAKPVQPAKPEVKVEDLYDIFNDLLADPIVDLEQPEFSISNIENAPFLGFDYVSPIKLPEKFASSTTQLVANDKKKVPILRLKLNRQ